MVRISATKYLDAKKRQEESEDVLKRVDLEISSRSTKKTVH